LYPLSFTIASLYLALRKTANLNTTHHSRQQLATTHGSNRTHVHGTVETTPWRWEGPGTHGYERPTRKSEAKTAAGKLEDGAVETLSVGTYW